MVWARDGVDVRGGVQDVQLAPVGLIEDCLADMDLRAIATRRGRDLHRSPSRHVCRSAADVASVASRSAAASTSAGG